MNAFFASNEQLIHAAADNNRLGHVSCPHARRFAHPHIRPTVRRRRNIY